MAKDNNKSWAWESMSDDDASSMDLWEAYTLNMKTPEQAMSADTIGAEPDSIPEAMFDDLEPSPPPPPSSITRAVIYDAKAIKKKWQAALKLRYANYIRCLKAAYHHISNACPAIYDDAAIVAKWETAFKLSAKCRQ